jgi:hypothetical protein
MSRKSARVAAKPAKKAEPEDDLSGEEEEVTEKPKRKRAAPTKSGMHLFFLVRFVRTFLVCDINGRLQKKGKERRRLRMTKKKTQERKTKTAVPRKPRCQSKYWGKRGI